MFEQEKAATYEVGVEIRSPPPEKPSLLSTTINLKHCGTAAKDDELRQYVLAFVGFCNKQMPWEPLSDEAGDPAFLTSCMFCEEHDRRNNVPRYKWRCFPSQEDAMDHQDDCPYNDMLDDI